MYKDPKKRLAYGERMLRNCEKRGDTNSFAAAIAAVCVISARKQLAKGVKHGKDDHYLR